MTRSHHAPAQIFGEPLDRVPARVGSLAQVARVDQFEATDGPARGSRVLRLVTGGGVEIEIHPDRAFDIGRLTAFGVPLTWTSPNGITAPGLYETHGDGHGRTFGGGLLATCGLDHIGAPVDDGGRHFPQHGRIGSVPGVVERVGVVGDEIVVEGVVRQATLHEENLVLRRRIAARLGGTTITVDDTVTNEGWRPEPHLVLYHCNLGWPLVSEHATLEAASRAVTLDGRDDPATDWAEISAPVAGYAQRVYVHDVTGRDGRATVANPALGLALTVRFDTGTLPTMFEWKMFGHGQNVLGIEPSNTRWIAGRVAAANAGELPVLEPGKSVEYALAFDVARAGEEADR